VARLAVFASGNGSNFEALAKGLENSGHHIVGLFVDRREAFAVQRASKLGIPVRFVSYKGRDKDETEREILAELRDLGADLIALAGFMRLLGPLLVDSYPNRIVNIHPSLLPKYPGKHGIAESYDSGDRELGITIHYVDHGLDSGPIILQQSFSRDGSESIEEIEAKIHSLEHRFYPSTVKSLLDAIEAGKGETK